MTENLEQVSAPTLRSGQDEGESNGQKQVLTLEEAKALLRGKVAFYDRDRWFSPDIEASQALIESSAYDGFMPPGVLPSC